ncbi:MAG: GntP family permease [Oscillospiraceae bacterium]|jgi:GntP family gluconate:H+ symporter|nr:GntP family permease [Oscillospiraceae bacterium]MBQ5567137.1 GntP family permease [Oscillospiraceae bacterium]
MAAQFSTLGALIGLAIAIVLIIRKVAPAYCLILGALVGGLIGGGGLAGTVSTMVSGAGSMMSSVLRILTSGILAGALIKTGSAQKIAEAIVDKLGQKRAIMAISIATMIICAVGVFIDISVITVAPIALAIGEKAGLSKSGVLLAMIGGGKAGNIVSPNPNTIAVSEAFEQPLTSVMMRNIIPALFALVITIILANMLSKKNDDPITAADLEGSDKQQLPGFLPAILGPVVVIALLALRPICGVSIDPLIALPVGGIVSVLVTGNAKNLVAYTEYGLSKVIGVSILLIGTGTIAGIIKASALQSDVTNLLAAMHMPAFILAPLSGILMAAATASTTAGATVAAQTFSPALLSAGVPALAAAAMIHAGATVLDSLPHGSFFHATGGSVGMGISKRMKLIPFEALVGLTSTIVAVVIYVIAG